MTVFEIASFSMDMAARWQRIDENKAGRSVSRLITSALKQSDSHAIRALTQVKPHERRIMCATYLLGMTRREICEEMSISVDDYKIISRDTKHKLRRIIDENK